MSVEEHGHDAPVARFARLTGASSEACAALKYELHAMADHLERRNDMVGLKHLARIADAATVLARADDARLGHVIDRLEEAAGAVTEGT